MTGDLRCPSCQVLVEPANIDRERELATCGACGRAPASGPNHVLTGESCSRFEVNVERTNTNIDEIWAMDGSVTLECSELSGSVKFAGCH